MGQKHLIRALAIVTVSLFIFIEPSFAAKIYKLKGKKALIKAKAGEFKKNQKLTVYKLNGDASGKAVVRGRSKRRGSYVIQLTSGGWGVGYEVSSADMASDDFDSGLGAEEAPPEESPRPKKSNRVTDTSKFNFMQLGSIGSFSTSNDFVNKSALAAGFDFGFKFNQSDWLFRAGLWGFNFTEKAEGPPPVELSYTLLTLDVGVNYLFFNSSFIMGAGARLGVSAPSATIKINNVEIPFSGESSMSYAATLFAYYRFASRGYLLGADYRMPFYDKDLDLEDSSYVLVSFGKSW